MTNQTPEEIARDQIDGRLSASGWIIQDKNKIDFSAGPGLAVREYTTDIGEVDYALFVDRKLVGVCEAKRNEEGHHITEVEEQSGGYAKSRFKHVKGDSLQFVYEATGILTRFTDLRDPKPRSREVYSFHRPETLREYLKETESLRGRLIYLPELAPAGLRDCQFTAIGNLEKSFKENRPRALIHLATGAGKTFTAINFVYRLLKHANAKRVLFLVDTRNLGEQAEAEFQNFQPKDDNRKFVELYNVARLQGRHIPKDSQVYISTIQRLYSILKGKDLDPRAEDLNPNEISLGSAKPSEVSYSENVPIEFFDFIIIDECHRSIYNLWRQVLDYFDAFLIGLTATPDKRTFGFFNENVVSEYSYTQSVADGVNVGYDLYVIETEITKAGSKLAAKEWVDKRERLTRKTRWEQLDEEQVYTPTSLDREVVNPSQIRQIIKTFKEKIPEIFPGRTEIPKTLIFAKTDSHADDIIQKVREEFAEGNDFCKKITYQTDENPKSLLASFRNSYNPRIAVTVDMIATGTDVKPLECLLFMRDVRSKGYYEQMLGRGVRTLDDEKLKQVTPSATAKTHFVVIDAVGVAKSQKTENKPLERKKSIPLKDLLAQVLMGSEEEDVFVSLAGRLARLAHELSPAERAEFARLAKGSTPGEVVNALIDAHDPDSAEDLAAEKHKVRNPSEKQMAEARTELIRKASSLFNGELNTFIEKVRQSHDQIIDKVNLDRVTYAGWDAAQKDQAKKMVEEFKDFIKTHKNEITALKILYNEPHHRKKITYAMIRELFEALKRSKPNLAPVRVFEAYAALENMKGESPKAELTAIVSLVRRVCGVDSELVNYEAVVNRNFQTWVMRKQAGATKYTSEQMEWLRMIKDHVATSFHVEESDLDSTPFGEKGGLGKMHELFGAGMEKILAELNEGLVA